MLTKLNLKAGLGVGFWSMYAAVYDTLLGLRPYTGMLDEMVEGLGAPRGAFVLDAGCGSGNLTRRLLNGGYRVEAVDSSPGMLRRANQKCPEAGCRTVDLDRALECPDGTYSAVTCSNVLYSLPNPRGTLVELLRVLKPGGTLVLANPKPGFNMKEILDQHWGEQNQLGRLRMVLRIPKLLLLSAFNLLLLREEQRRRFYFPEQEELRQLLLSLGYDRVEVRPTYAGQGWLASARKPAASAF